MYVENVFGCRRPELRPLAVAGKAHVERRSDGGVNGWHGALYAQLQLWYRHGVSNWSVWAFHDYGACQRFTELKTEEAESEI